MRNAMKKTTFREIRLSFGRFAAILAIVALGVGFFSGLRITKDAMIASADGYTKETAFYDFRLISTMGFTDEDVAAFASADGVITAEGACFTDFITESDEGGEDVLSAHSITSDVNMLSLKYGRMPQAADECIIDNRFYGEDSIGRVIKVATTNGNDIISQLAYTEFTVVGIATSPCYMNYERGTTKLGSGTVDSFIYVPREAFTQEYHSEIYLKTDDGEKMYSDEYNDAINTAMPALRELLDQRAEIRLEAVKKQYSDAVNSIETQITMLKAQYPGTLPDAVAEKLAPLEEALTQAQNELAALQIPDTYMLTRNDNIGYVCFESDASIVEGISKVFPIFFFLIAALVCMTTMTRMVSEQRVQIGILKSMGYGEGAVVGKYLVYSGIAAAVGCVAGYTVGIILIPRILWQTYTILYDFGDLKLVFSLPLAIISVTVSLLCSVGATWLSCRREFREVPARLIRPKSPKSGKRILPERTFIWKHLSFLQKVSIRNLFRYKKRFFMMIIGIGGCTALLLTGYGIRDSIKNIVTDQYDKISNFDYSASFSEAPDESIREDFASYLSGDAANMIFVHESAMTAAYGDSSKTVHTVVYSDSRITDYYNLHTVGGKPVALPEKGCAVISNGLADALSVGIGDSIVIKYSDTQIAGFEVSGISENYINYFIYCSAETFEGSFGFEAPEKTVYIKGAPNADANGLSAKISSYGGVVSVTATETLRERISGILKNLDYIVFLVIGCAGALAFIVLYNLTNINITERRREIATIKVLGFYPLETAIYVFRENLLLTALGAIVGLPLGKWLHAFVMDQIDIDMMTFNVKISFMSVLISLLFTFAFALITDFVMYFKLGRIDMANSLKSIE